MMQLAIISTIVLLLLIIFLLLLFAIISIGLECRILNTQIYLKVSIKCMGIRFLLIEYPNPSHSSTLFNKFMSKLESLNERRKEKNIEDSKNDLQQLLELFEILKNRPQMEQQIKQFSLKSLRIKEFKWYTTIGFEEADKTAWLTGLLWALKTTLLGFIQHQLLQHKMDTPTLIIQPDYSQVFTFKTHFKCMIQFRLGHAIRTAYQFAKNKKGRQEKCQKNIQYKV